ncbi:MAG: hypothetical protein Q8N89_13935 [Azonexus sp.]|nr:hypothetical protein [Azonexus sp.]
MSYITPPLLQTALSRIFLIRRRTWILITGGLFLVLILIIWATISAAGWLFGVARESVSAAPEAVRAVTAQVVQVIPGAREKLGELVPALRAEAPLRDVSGTDPAPVARYPGLSRVHWHRDGRDITVRYGGAANFAAVLDHYVKGFTAQGYRHDLLSATPDEERHEYVKGDDRVGMAISRQNHDNVMISLIIRLP